MKRVWELGEPYGKKFEKSLPQTEIDPAWVVNDIE
jgi:hypothetical protein